MALNKLYVAQTAETAHSASSFSQPLWELTQVTESEQLSLRSSSLQPPTSANHKQLLVQIISNCL